MLSKFKYKNYKNKIKKTFKGFLSIFNFKKYWIYYLVFLGLIILVLVLLLVDWSFVGSQIDNNETIIDEVVVDDSDFLIDDQGIKTKLLEVNESLITPPNMTGEELIKNWEDGDRWSGEVVDLTYKDDFVNGLFELKDKTGTLLDLKNIEVKFIIKEINNSILQKESNFGTFNVTMIGAKTEFIIPVDLKSGEYLLDTYVYFDPIVYNYVTESFIVE